MDQAVKHGASSSITRAWSRLRRSTSGAQVIYALRLLNDSGKVWTVHVDAASGAVQ